MVYLHLHFSIKNISFTKKDAIDPMHKSTYGPCVLGNGNLRIVIGHEDRADRLIFFQTEWLAVVLRYFIEHFSWIFFFKN